MTGFEPQTSGIGSNHHSANWATASHCSIGIKLLPQSTTYTSNNDVHMHLRIMFFLAKKHDVMFTGFLSDKTYEQNQRS